MSVITVQFGQCGNQIGHEWFSLLAKDIRSENRSNVSGEQIAGSNYENEARDRWFVQTEKCELLARTILVDTEEKVIREICKKQIAANDWKYNSDNIIAPTDGGSGNNWAYGYGCKGPQLRESVMNCLRREVERSDNLISIVNLLSSAGGTGSGVGSFICECLRDEYPTKTIVNAIVFPYQSGETVNQNYNTLLTLAKVYDIADMHIILQNDRLQKMCETLMRNNDVCLKDLNVLIGLKMSSALQPVGSVARCSLSDIVSHMASHPGLKFVTVKTAPHIQKESEKYESPFRWNILVHHMKQTLRLCSLNEESVADWEYKVPAMTQTYRHSLLQYHCSVSNLLITRGSGMIESQYLHDLNDSILYPKWIPSGSRLKHFHQNRKILNMDKFITLITNNSSIRSNLNTIIEKAWNLFSQKAYLHQYGKFNVNEEEFVEAFAKSESVVKLYEELQ